MKIDWSLMAWEPVQRPEAWENKSPEQRAEETAWAWDQWIIASCAERNGGHRWWLDWDEEDGLWLHCQYCLAGVDELYPDGQDLIECMLPVPGSEKPLVISGGSADLDAPVHEWHGLVKAEVWEEKYYSWEYGAYEYNAGIIVEAAWLSKRLIENCRLSCCCSAATSTPWRTRPGPRCTSAGRSQLTS